MNTYQISVIAMGEIFKALAATSVGDLNPPDIIGLGLYQNSIHGQYYVSSEAELSFNDFKELLTKTGK